MSQGKYIKDENGEHVLRQFYVEDVLAFSLFVLVDEPPLKEVMKNFLASKDWLWYESYFAVRYNYYLDSHNGLKINIKVKPKNKKDSEEVTES